MDYQKHYDRLIERGRTRVLAGYSERHHIVPVCIGGSNDPANIVRLTPEEHYVAHQLLVKIYPGNRKIICAAFRMTVTGKNTAGRYNKLFGWLRRKMSETMRLRMTGRKEGSEAKAKRAIAVSLGNKGKPKSAAHRAALASAKLGKKIGPQSAEHRAKLAESNRIAHLARDKSKYRTEAYRAMQSARMRDIWLERRSQTTET